jgi:hypothetical protein
MADELTEYDERWRVCVARPSCCCGRWAVQFGLLVLAAGCALPLRRCFRWLCGRLIVKELVKDLHFLPDRRIFHNRFSARW